MADFNAGSPVPQTNGQGKSQRTPSAGQQHKRNNRKPKAHTQSNAQLDGTVSDSVTNPAVSSPRSKKPSQPRQSVAAPIQNGNMVRMNGQKARPVSIGGPMIPMTPAKEQAYAGPTFQASPAPSSLPVPKFFSKSVPDITAQSSLQSKMEGQSIESSPEPDLVRPVAAGETQQSALDMLFKADKAEKERSKSNGMLSPEIATRRMPATEPRNPFQHPGRSLFLQELDGENDEMPSPRTIPPERPHPTERSHSSPGVRSLGPPEQTNEQRDAYTQSLKDLLFNNINSTSTPPQSRAQSSPQQNLHTPSPSPFQRSSSGPTSPALPSAQQQQDNYALHYGNRNLSPLFKAAANGRNETPSRPSGLRQEVPNFPPVELDGAPVLPPQQRNPRNSGQRDPNSFSRDFLDQHLRGHHSDDITSQLPFMNGGTGGAALGRPASSSNAPPPSAPVASAGAFPGRRDDGGISLGTSPRANGTGSRDVKSMEDDLRKMLKLNVLG